MNNLIGMANAALGGNVLYGTPQVQYVNQYGQPIQYVNQYGQPIAPPQMQKIQYVNQYGQPIPAPPGHPVYYNQPQAYPQTQQPVNYNPNTAVPNATQANPQAQMTQPNVSSPAKPVATSSINQNNTTTAVQPNAVYQASPVAHNPSMNTTTIPQQQTPVASKGSNIQVPPQQQFQPFSYAPNQQIKQTYQPLTPQTIHPSQSYQPNFIPPQNAVKPLPTPYAKPLPTPGSKIQAPSTAPVSAPVKMIQGVTLDEKIGQGAFGNVYRGLWEGTEVACKEIRDPAQSEELKQEISMLATLDHPSVVRFFGMFEEPQKKTQFIIMEYLSKGSLDKFLRGSTESEITPKEMLSMCTQAASGIQYLHKKGIIHRDIAARNLLVTHTDGKYVIKVSDFGLCRKLDEKTAEYSQKSSKIPIKWSSPEALKFGNFSAASDVWSFGVLMWEIFTLGQIPYTGWDNMDTMDQVFKGYRLPKPEMCPDPVYAIILKCWMDKPQERLTMVQVCAALLDYGKQQFNLARGSSVMSLELSNSGGSSSGSTSFYMSKTDSSGTSVPVQPQPPKQPQLDELYVKAPSSLEK